MKQISPSFDLDTPLGVDRGPNANECGIICAANESRFTSSHYSEPLTSYTVGWNDPQKLDELLRRIFPEITVTRKFEFKSANNAEEFLSDVDEDERAIGAAFKRVERKGTTVLGKTANRGLTVRVDHDEVDENSANWREAYVQWLLRRLNRNRLRRGIALVNAAAVNVARTWTGANPDGLLRASLKAGADITGIRPNTILIGEAAWDLRADVYEAANTPYAGVAAQKTPEELARKLGVDHIEIIQARYQSTASAKASVLGSVAYHYFVEPGAMKDDPSHVKAFISPARGGQKYGVYVQEYEKFTDITVEVYESTMVTTSTGIRKDTIS